MELFYFYFTVQYFPTLGIIIINFERKKMPIFYTFKFVFCFKDWTFALLVGSVSFFPSTYLCGSVKKSVPSFNSFQSCEIQGKMISIHSTYRTHACFVYPPTIVQFLSIELAWYLL
jgi:hypothetical protein